LDIIKLRYSESFIREAMRSYWVKQIGLVFPSVTLLLTVFLVYRVFNGDRTWMIGVLGSVIVLGLAMMVASYYVHLHRSLQRLKRMKTPEATLELGAERFCVKSGASLSDIEWSLISEIWRFEKVWFLFFSASEFMTLPTAGMPAEAKSFIISKAKGIGAKIV